ncbi:hypothetical protein AMTRI_Chr10g3780 [Amborella trichopoda]|uniref:Uncharacterized protein n=1 Tax=Amborella trichopoda TaxID=13333 RepID=W1NJ06_AMBTC|nr:snakin-2 [Amborella trichopoda]ERM95508.1 hypothetical protein AMTR_s00151p00069160 [Amborella trichopoda]|eukprot:XP_006828092.1 snakin-2 [Amborella trichopoda]
MALRELLLYIVLLLVISQMSSQSYQDEDQDIDLNQIPGSGGNGSSKVGIDCPKLCGERCKLHSRPNRCLRACGTCCDRCQCVPPGTSGNKEVCGTCYINMTTHRNESKCP